MTNLLVNKKIITVKNFLTNSQIDKIILEIHNLMLVKLKKKKNKKIKFKRSKFFLCTN